MSKGEKLEYIQMGMCISGLCTLAVIVFCVITLCAMRPIRLQLKLARTLSLNAQAYFHLGQRTLVLPLFAARLMFIFRHGLEESPPH